MDAGREGNWRRLWLWARDRLWARDWLRARGWLRDRDQRTAMLWLGGLLMLGLGSWSASGGWRGEWIAIDGASGLAARLALDVNRASWPELSQLPGLGPALAQRLVAEREQRGPFARVDEVERVAGIGPLKLAKIRPYLTVGEGAGSRVGTGNR